MKHPFAKKIPRHHPQVQDRQMMVDGFQDFAFKAFHPKYEKSAAPLSKRRNGIGPTHHQLGNVIVGDARLASRLTMAVGGLFVLSAFQGKIRKSATRATKEATLLLNRAGRQGVLATATVLAFAYNS